MKRTLLLCLLTCTLSYLPFTVYAGIKEDYEEAYKIYIAAGASAAAYSDRIGELVNHYLEQDGWKIDHYVQAEGHSGARYLIAQKEGFPYDLVAIVGTENHRDIKTDLKVDKIYFAGSTPKEFITNAAKQDVPPTEPKVHRGFNQFVKAGLSAVLLSPKQTSISFTDLLQTDQSRKLLLTGHSLGGAAATLAGARLLSGGISPDQLEVITFGAPAVGNAAFANKFSPNLHLTRIVNSGDMVTGALQTFVGGYQQFGQQIKWHAPDTTGDAHQLIGYIDSAMKNYYDKRRLAISAGIELPVSSTHKQKNPGRVYIAPLVNNLPNGLTADFLYMQEALQDEYQQILPDYVTAKTLVNWQNEARASGCRWAVVSDINATQVRQKEKTYYITLTQTVYDVTSGIATTTATFSTVTYNLTPLEAFIHNFKGIEAHLMDQFAKNKGNDTIISPAATKP
ncbi:MAG: lipase class 3 [Firmicutes bacterium]|nr:lipase class 3 [Bacillota bacterium]